MEFWSELRRFEDDDVRNVDSPDRHFIELLTCLIVLLALSAASFAEGKDEYRFSLGESRNVVIDSLFSSGDARLLNDAVELERYETTFSPFGVVGHQYRYRFSGGQLVQMEHGVGGWVGPKKEHLTEEMVEKVNARQLAYFDGLIETYGAQKINEGDGFRLYAFATDKVEGRIYVRSEPDVSGQTVLWKKGMKPVNQDNHVYESWFGLGSISMDGDNRRKETNSIPYKDRQTYVWKVKTDFTQDTPYQMKLVFPTRPAVVPEGVEFDASDNSIVVPMRSYEETVVVHFVIDEGDPLGVHKAFLTANGKTFAGISYKIENGR
ncbi:hypothetical protein [Marinobacter sp. CHS3-4]|uniref:hypothetical protein n=1 Tax=Marinobacter sp. CHS3-4 TaxID=3045174 RepID=UPI0024B59EBE|nr:hypothetical protein [Marinobacter sp. CHS3-4]MDI9244598.1 hypothetical protein [Marinobacter sp. CHS3-4]